MVRGGRGTADTSKFIKNTIKIYFHDTGPLSVVATQNGRKMDQNSVLSRVL